MRLPPPPIPEEEQKLPVSKVATRWRAPSTYVKLKAKEAGIELVPVTLPPVMGIRMRDLLRLEAQLREKTAPAVLTVVRPGTKEKEASA
jgi:hypothetical protein